MFIFLLKGENIFFITLKPGQRIFYQAKEQSFAEDDFCRDLAIENVKLKIYQTENKTLKDILNFLQGTEDNFVLANIIGQRSEAGFNWFLLDQGADQGIQPGLAVVDEQGVLIGTIAKIEKSISYLRPIFDRHASLAADIITSNELLEPNTHSDVASGIIQGEYGLTLKMKYIPLDKEIDIGDAVITAGLEENIRRGIIIGQVTEINKKPNAIFQQVIVKPLFNPNFRIVSVILP